MSDVAKETNKFDWSDQSVHSTKASKDYKVSQKNNVHFLAVIGLVIFFL